MPRHPGWIGVAFVAALGTAATAAPDDRTGDLSATLQRIGEKVEQYFARAQSLICLETVRLRPFGASSADQPLGRTIESELRLSWDGATGEAPATEARTVRQVLRINGNPPRKNDPHNCTTPEQHESETQPLSMFLPEQQRDHVFTAAGTGRVDDRRAILLDFRVKTRPSVSVSMVDGREDCVSFSLEGGTRGRAWIDVETFDVLRLDQGLIGLVDIPMPRLISLRGQSGSWTMERHDVSIRFKATTFRDPDETLMLPVSVSSMQITRGSATPRLWTTTNYTQYKRFLTGARVLQQ